MQIEISQHQEYLVIAGNGNALNRYKVKGNEIKDVYARFERVVYIGSIGCFETYVKNPETSETGWDIVYIEGVKEKIAEYYPHFDCFITKGYPCSNNNKVVEFYNLERDDYELKEFNKEVA